MIEDFIDILNSFGLKDNKRKKMEIDIEKNYICDFLFIDNNKNGQKYKEIYDNYINKQNKVLKDLLNKRVVSGLFVCDCKIKKNIQQMKGGAIFTLKMPKKLDFISLLFD